MAVYCHFSVFRFEMEVSCHFDNFIFNIPAKKIFQASVHLTWNILITDSALVIAITMPDRHQTTSIIATQSRYQASPPRATIYFGQISQYTHE